MSFQLSAEKNRGLVALLKEIEKRGLDPVKILERAYKEKTEGAEVNETGQSYVSV